MKHVSSQLNMPFQYSLVDWYTIDEDITIDGPTLPSSTFKYIEFPVKEFNPLQTQALHHIESDDNIVISAPPGSGKTMIIEMLIAYTLAQNKKCIYVSPLKLLTQEKLAEWKLRFKNISSNYEPIILPGNKTPDTNIQELIFNNNIFLVTNEMLFSCITKYSLGSYKYAGLSDVGCVIIDEAHYIGESNRGSTLEIALISLASLIPTARICFVSATLPNAQQLASWLSFISNKKTQLIESNYKPSKTQLHYIEFSCPKQNYQLAKKELLLHVLKNVEGQTIIFVPTIKIGYEVIKALRPHYPYVRFLYSSLFNKYKNIFIKKFTSGEHQIIVATSILSSGVNTPAKNVIIYDPRFTPTMTVPLPTIIQEIGRAGRPKYDPYGKAFIIAPKIPPLHKIKTFFLSTYQNYSISSDLNSQDSLITHILTSVMSSKVKSAEHYYSSYYSKTLHNFINESPHTKDFILSTFHKCVSDNLIHKKYKVFTLTTLGQAILIYQVLPSIFSELYNILCSNYLTQTIDSSHALTLLANSQLPETITPNPTPQDILALHQLSCPYTNISSKKDFFKALLWCSQNIHNLQDSHPVQYHTLISPLETFKSNISRYLASIKYALASNFSSYSDPNKLRLKSDIDILLAYINNGIPQELSCLFTVKGFNIKTITKLLDNNIKSIHDLLSNRKKIASLLNKQQYQTLYYYLDNLSYFSLFSQNTDNSLNTQLFINMLSNKGDSHESTTNSSL